MNSSSWVPVARSLDQLLIVEAAMNTAASAGNQALSVSRLARLLVKNSPDHISSPVAIITNRQMKM
ncbi:MAG: hypothetical protein H6835_05095 [Planctomycetes bacterium]|nr:hypothetical protein [Planctomycetota bacterium]